VSRFQRLRVTCGLLLTTMLVSIGLVVVAASPSNAAVETAQSRFPTVCSQGSLSGPRLTAGRFGEVASVSASVWCNVAYSMSIDLTLIFAGGEITRHFEMTQPNQTEVTGTVSRRCTTPGWYMGRAHFSVSAPGLSFDRTVDSQWVFFLCGELFP
jgi:hypothetical protein